jgi:hypothetical protein
MRAGVLLFTVAVTVGGMTAPAHAQATDVPSVPGPRVSIKVGQSAVSGDLVQGPRRQGFHFTTSTYALIEVTVDPRWEAAPVTADVYVGVLLPTGSILTSRFPVPQQLETGLVPLVRGVTIGTGSPGFISFVGHVFNGSEPSGLYTVFALLVTSDADPTDSRNWLGNGAALLVFRPQGGS